jgi:RsiW-degrading membrane proteinase PrsW (M82 family)
MADSEAWLVSILAAAVPTICYVLVLWWFDRYEKEPRRLLLVAFVWGAVPAIILAVIAETVLGQPFTTLSEASAELMSSSVLAPVVEELTKGLAVLLLFLFFRSEFDGVLDGIIYGATIGFGFAMTENVFYFASAIEESGVEGLTMLVLMRSFVFGMNHALFTSVFGMALGYARAAKRGLKRWIAPPVGLLGAMFLHGVHNLFASLTGVVCFSLLVSVFSDWAGVVVILVVIFLAARQEKGWIVAHLKGEVASGQLTQDEYDMISSYRRRLAARWRARSHSGLAEARRLGKLAELATELAFKLEQGDEHTAQKLRSQIALVHRAPTLPTQGGPDVGSAGPKKSNEERA